MADLTVDDRGGEPVRDPDSAWDDLTPDQRAGMTREYWEGELDSVARTALAGVACSHPDCVAPRWVEVGSFYCETHTRLVAATAEPR
jgi:hypothetical protein